MATSNTDTHTYSVENTCEHHIFFCNTCSEHFIDDWYVLDPDNATCPHCDGPKEEVDDKGPFIDCECVTDQITYANESFHRWQQCVPADYDWYIIEAKRLGWRGVPGYMFIADDDRDLIAKLDLNTQWTITVDDVDDTAEAAPIFHITRYHHDAPTGEVITVRPASFDEALTHVISAADTWVGDTIDFLNKQYSPDVCDDETLRAVCEDLGLEPLYFTDPTAYIAKRVVARAMGKTVY